MKIFKKEKNIQKKRKIFKKEKNIMKKNYSS